MTLCGLLLHDLPKDISCRCQFLLENSRHRCDHLLRHLLLLLLLLLSFPLLLLLSFFLLLLLPFLLLLPCPFLFLLLPLLATAPPAKAP
jgi:hypothetical protein